jgi:hypothetical protein
MAVLSPDKNMARLRRDQGQVHSDGEQEADRDGNRAVREGRMPAGGFWELHPFSMLFSAYLASLEFLAHF